MNKVETNSDGVKMFIIIKLQMHLVTVKNDKLKELVSRIVMKLVFKFVYLFSRALYSKWQFKKNMLFNCFLQFTYFQLLMGPYPLIDYLIN